MSEVDRVEPVDRVFGVDLARGIALLGMFAAHVAFAENEQFFDGRSSILFATVAGVSLGFVTGGSAPPPPHRRGTRRLAIAMRGLALIGIGLLLAALQPPVAVILDYYGVAFLLLVPLLFARRAVLAGVAAAVIVLAPPVVLGLQDEVDVAAISTPLAIPANWLVFGYYPVLIWLAFPLIGLIAARSDLRRRRTQLVMIGSGLLAAVAGYSAAILVPGVSAEAHSGTAAEVVGSGGVAVAVIGAATLLGSISAPAGRVIRIVLRPVAAAGAMSLSLYTAHVLVLTALRAAVIRPDGSWDYPPSTLPALIVVTLVIATLWRLFLGTGPLEKGLRELTRLGPRAPRQPATPRV